MKKGYFYLEDQSNIEKDYFNLEDEQNPSSPKKNSILSRLTFSWAIPILNNRNLESLCSSFQLPFEEKVENQALYNLVKSHSLFVALLKSNKNQLIFQTIFDFLAVLNDYSIPIFIELLLYYIESDES